MNIDVTRLTTEQIDQIKRQYKVSLSNDDIERLHLQILKRPPTVTECILWSIQGSEHCAYKSSKKYLKQLPITGADVLLGVGEDAAVVRVATDNKGEDYGIAISHESHNHPSQIVPFEGAATGVGGNVRDISCMGAEVIALADGLRFGDKREAKTHWLTEGVVAGIASYGNALGIPNIAGDIYYHPQYQQNCLVTVTTLGAIKASDIIHSYVPSEAEGYQLILVGKPTDNSGFGGASFASENLSSTKANKGAIQEPNAFLERHLLKANQALFKKLQQQGLITKVAFKDLGAGGIACASVELADAGGFGCEVDLDSVPTSLDDLDPSVILLAETQERFMWAVPPDLVDMVLTHYNQQYDLPNVSSKAQAVVVGKVTAEPIYRVTYQNQLLVDALASDVTAGLSVDRPAEPLIQNRVSESVVKLDEQQIESTLLTLLSSPNVASDKPVYQHYDKQVQGRTVIERGQAQAGVIAPFNNDDYPQEIQQTAAALALGHNPLVSMEDSGFGAMQAVVSAYQKVAATGAMPTALTDCLCFGSPENPHHMQQFIDAVEKLADTASQLELPVVAGNVSFYNCSGSNAIPPSPMISCLGKMSDAKKAITGALQYSDNLVVCIAGIADSLCGSVVASFETSQRLSLPHYDLAAVKRQTLAVIEAIDNGWLQSARTIDAGGKAMALAKLCCLGNKGMQLKLEQQSGLANWLFSEGPGFMVELDTSALSDFATLMQQRGVSYEIIGKTQDLPNLEINQQIKISLEALNQAYYKGE